MKQQVKKQQTGGIKKVTIFIELPELINVNPFTNFKLWSIFCWYKEKEMCLTTFITDDLDVEEKLQKSKDVQGDATSNDELAEDDVVVEGSEARDWSTVAEPLPGDVGAVEEDVVGGHAELEPPAALPAEVAPHGDGGALVDQGLAQLHGGQLAQAGHPRLQGGEQQEQEGEEEGKVDPGKDHGVDRREGEQQVGVEDQRGGAHAEQGGEGHDWRVGSH